MNKNQDKVETLDDFLNKFQLVSIKSFVFKNKYRNLISYFYSKHKIARLAKFAE
jgi:hypothetical protein